MIVGARGPSGHADVPNDLPGRDVLTDVNDRWVQGVIHVSRQRREVETMRDDHDGRGVAVGEVWLADGDDLTSGRRADRRVHRSRDVEAVVEATPARAER